MIGNVIWIIFAGWWLALAHITTKARRDTTAASTRASARTSVWNLSGIDAVYATCSPHRVALCVQHLRNYYVDDFAEQLVALLPDWTRWLAARNGTASELADRRLPYAPGRPDLQPGDDDRRSTTSHVSWGTAPPA